MQRVGNSHLSRRDFLKTALVGGVVAAAPGIGRAALAAPAAADDGGRLEALFVEMDDFVIGRMAELRLPGAAVGVIAGGREHAAGFGVTNVDHPLPVDAETLFQIGSTGKTYTGTALMRLIEQGKVHLDAPVRDYLPEFRVADPKVAEAVRLRHLVTHTAGWFGDDFTETGDGDDALARYVAEMANLPQIAPLGQHFSYNNAAVCLAGRVIEVVTNQTFEAAIGALVLEPLGLEQTFFFPEEIMTKAFAVGHGAPDDDPNGAPVVLEPWTDARALAAAGGEASSLTDQLRYARFHLGDGTVDGERVLSRASMSRMQTPLGPGGSLADIILEGVGVTWLLSNLGGTRVVSHGGSSIGQQSAFAMVPERQFAVTMLTNADAGAVLGVEATAWALERFLGLARPTLPPATVSPARLGEYVGNYAFAEALVIQIDERDGGLFLDLTLPGETNPEIASPLPFVGDDLVASEYMGVTLYSDFVRDDDGKIGWFRLSGRLGRRL